MTQTSKQRMLTALKGKIPDRLPVTTHHVQPYFLKKNMDGITNDEFFDHFGLDPVLWICPVKARKGLDEYLDTSLECQVSSETWRVEKKEVVGQKYLTFRYNFVTPKKTLTMIMQSNDYTSWVTEHLIKDEEDIDIIAEYSTSPICDMKLVNEAADNYGQRGLVRGTVPGFDVFGQPGVWQDAACLVGIEKLIMKTFDDSKWVHQLLGILLKRKKVFVESLEGAKFDILELGGGDASSTVISPRVFDEFVAPYDSEIISIAHSVGQKIVYHTCGGMMPILENIAAMKPDAMETFTPTGMGGDVDLVQARKRLPDNICMIGGFDQLYFFKDCNADQTRAEVRRCFDAAGKDGAFILCPSDHFFDAEPELLMAFADEAHKCVYNCG